MKKNAIFEQCLANVSPEIKMEVRLNMDIANKIADILKTKNMTQRDLAALMDKKESEVSRWLTGSHGFTIKTIARISAALGEDIVETRKDNYVKYVMFPIEKYVSQTDVKSGVFSGAKTSQTQIPFIN